MRMTRQTAAGYFEHTLGVAEVAEKGKIACLDLGAASPTRGQLVAGRDDDTDLWAIGYFEGGMTGNGSAKARVRLFREVWIHWFKNDLANPVLAADVGSECFLHDAETVSADGTGKSVAGRVWLLSSDADFTVGVAMKNTTGAP